MEMLTQEQLDELFSLDPRQEIELTEEEMEAWYMSAVAEAERLNSLNPYLEI